MSYFPHAFHKMLVAKDGTDGSGFIVASGVASSALTAGQVGLFDYATNLTVALSGSTAYGASNGTTTAPLFYLAQGSYHTTDKVGPFHGGYKESVKSKGINPKYVSAFYVTEPNAPVQDIYQIAAVAGCNVTCDTTYRLRLDLKGSPALRFLTHNVYYTLDAWTGCCDGSSNNVDPNVVLLGWLDRLNIFPTLTDDSGNIFVQGAVWNRVLVSGAAATASATAAAALTVSERTGIKPGNRVIFTPTTATSATGSTIAGNLFTVGTATNTIFSVGQVLTGTGVAAGTTIVSRVSGGGGSSSTFLVNISQTVASTTISSASPVIAYVSAAYTAATGSGAVALVAANTIQTSSGSVAINNVTTTTITPRIYDSITTATYTPLTGATAPDTVDSFLELVGAYVDTTFGDCSFNPKDHIEYQPIEIYPSLLALDPLGAQCSTACFVPTETQQAVQGRGFGETIIRELILAKRYQQEPWQQDPRLREVLDYNPFAEVTRGTRYFSYHLLHSVPRKSNPTGTMDNDQYMIKIVTPARNTAFETGIRALLVSANNYDAIKTSAGVQVLP
jgi:hypothetical protein